MEEALRSTVMLAARSSSTSSSSAEDVLPPLTSLSYIAPSIPTILTLSSFILLLSLSTRLFSRLLPGSAPVLAPLFLGLIYGAPLSSILEAHLQRSISTIGYLGLILLLVQGGSETRLDVLSSLANAVLALVVGLTGIGLPILFSVVVLPAAFGYGRVESFAVGAALSSTSLGTVFAVIQTLGSGYGDASEEKRKEGETVKKGEGEGEEDDAAMDLINTRAGTVLIGAALLDDIIGLVLSSVVVTLPPDSSSSSTTKATVAPWPLARPIVASVLILALTALLCRWVLRPLFATRHTSITRSFSRCQSFLTRRTSTSTWLPLTSSDLALVAFVATVAAFATIAEETKSSILIGVFCAGAMLAYCSERMELALRPLSEKIKSHPWHPHKVLSDRLLPIQNGLLLPFFFASIGFAIPLASLFHGKTVWRGIIFAGLMGFAKCAAGGWVLLADWIERRKEGRQGGREGGCEGLDGSTRSGGELEYEPEVTPSNRIELGQTQRVGSAPQIQAPVQASSLQATPAWPPALFVGASLISRGEIGYLILNLARNVTGAGGAKLVNDEAFAVGIWAITLNTLVGPLVVGIMLQNPSVRKAVCKGRWGGVSRKDAQ
ncbi:hypothetical protein CF327_g4176 [Tilletia walkeri]|nr:hypothetical protein CF327_g4176 [Tilletia walkeri]